MSVTLRYACDADKCEATADEPLHGGVAWDVLGSRTAADTVWIDARGNLPAGWLAYRSDPRVVLCPVHATAIEAKNFA